MCASVLIPSLPAADTPSPPKTSKTECATPSLPKTKVERTLHFIGPFSIPTPRDMRRALEAIESLNCRVCLQLLSKPNVLSKPNEPCQSVGLNLFRIIQNRSLKSVCHHRKSMALRLSLFLPGIQMAWIHEIHGIQKRSPRSRRLGETFMDLDLDLDLDLSSPNEPREIALRSMIGATSTVAQMRDDPKP